MRATTWAVFGSLIINLLLGLLIAAVFSVAPAAAHPLGHGVCTHTLHRKPAAPSPAAVRRPAYLVEARMGWGPAG